MKALLIPAILLVASSAAADPKTPAHPGPVLTEFSPPSAEKCASITTEQWGYVQRVIADTPRTSGDVYKDKPLAELRNWTNDLRKAVAGARACAPVLDAGKQPGWSMFKALNPKGTWFTGADKIVERNYDEAEKWAAALDAEIDGTQTCIDTPGCMEKRKADEIAEKRSWVCSAIAQRAQALKDIATEKANPGGVVDLKLLHSMGELVQGLDAVEIPARKAAYTAIAKRPFSGSCP